MHHFCFTKNQIQEKKTNELSQYSISEKENQIHFWSTKGAFCCWPNPKQTLKVAPETKPWCYQNSHKQQTLVPQIQAIQGTPCFPSKDWNLKIPSGSVEFDLKMMMGEAQWGKEKGNIDERAFNASLSSSSEVFITIAEPLCTLSVTSMKNSTIKSFGSVVLIMSIRSFSLKFSYQSTFVSNTHLSSNSHL